MQIKHKHMNVNNVQINCRLNLKFIQKSETLVTLL